MLFSLLVFLTQSPRHLVCVYTSQLSFSSPFFFFLQAFPRKARGLDYDLNWSLAADSLTTRGEAYRNASVRDLLEFAPRGTVRVTKERAVEVIGGPEANPGKAEAFATDVFPGRKVMDVEEYEGRLTSVRI